jgi:nitrogen fixation-related uncharacterized protein
MSPLTLSFVLVGLGVFMWGLARLLDIYRPK